MQQGVTVSVYVVQHPGVLPEHDFYFMDIAFVCQFEELFFVFGIRVFDLANIGLIGVVTLE
jgi:hypothetical protein